MPGDLLLITYEFPPSGGGGVQRVAKFCRYLPAAGWWPAVVAASPVAGRPLDESLESEVRGTPVVRVPGRHVASALARALRPLKALARRSGGGEGRLASGTSGVPALSGRLARFVAVPDDAAFWIGPAVRAGVDLGRERGASAVLASGPPHSALVAGARVARELGVPFVADMRDAWRDNPVKWWPTPAHEARSLALERGALASADVVLAVSEPIAAEAREMGAHEALVLPNGFDPADLPRWRPRTEGPLRVVFMGTVYRGHSDPGVFLKGMAEAVSRGVDVTLDLVGAAPGSLSGDVAALGLADRVTLHGYLPHAEALAAAGAADVGLVLIADRPGAKASVTGKLYEYLGMGLPALVAGPSDGAAASLVHQARAGEVVAPDDPAAIAEALARLERAKRDGSLGRDLDAAVVAVFDRRAQAARLASVLDGLAGRS